MLVFQLFQRAGNRNIGATQFSDPDRPLSGRKSNTGRRTQVCNFANVFQTLVKTKIFLKIDKRLELADNKVSGIKARTLSFNLFFLFFQKNDLNMSNPD